MRRAVFIPLIAIILLLAGCKSTYYKTMRTLGKEKRVIASPEIDAELPGIHVVTLSLLRSSSSFQSS